tara:strand:+ start:6288 stop:6434 length:147 start_codon:yes stop_codon:yes gene_type:complete
LHFEGRKDKVARGFSVDKVYHERLIDLDKVATEDWFSRADATQWNINK